MLGYLSLDIICFSKLTVFLELRSRKTVRFSEQMMSADKYPSIFSRQWRLLFIDTTITTTFNTNATVTATAFESRNKKALVLELKEGIINNYWMRFL